MIKQSILLFSFIFNAFIYGQVCLSDAGSDMTVCGGKKSGSNYRVYLDGTGSSVVGGLINYEWVSLDAGISFSTSQSKRAEPYFNYPQDLTQDTEFRIRLRVYDDDENCQDFDTVLVVVQANMCPIPDVGDDLVVSNGCKTTVILDASDSSDPDDSSLNYQWSSLDGYDSNLMNSNSAASSFTFPSISSDQVFRFSVMVDDSENYISDTLSVTYLNNTAPHADAGVDFTTCESVFTLTAARSYDVDWNGLSYSWSLLDGSLEMEGSSSRDLVATSPINLDQSKDYNFELIVTETISGQEHCSDRDTVKVTIKENICPIADAGGDKRIPKFENRAVILNASSSLDPDGNDLTYAWIGPDGSVSNGVSFEVSDLSPTSSYTKYNYQLQVTDAEGAVSVDYIDVIFSEFSAPSAPKIFAVADHNRVLVSWDASAESSIDSLTGYADFEGYKLYRSIDGGITWGGNEDKLFDFDGNFIGWIPYAQFDLSDEKDINHCIYTNDDCENDGLKRNTSIYGLDPLAPRFSFGINSGIEYSFIDSNVVDGIEYTYTVCAYDIGLEPFSIEYTQDDSTLVYTSDTIWADTNPDKFLGPSILNYYDVFGNLIRSSPNPEGGFPYLETVRGESPLDNNFITAVPGYTASNISFPDENDIEAIFLSDSSNIGTGERNYFIVDREEIASDKLLKYQVRASQGPLAIDGIAVEDPFVYVYEVDSDGYPKYTEDFSASSLNFFQEDSLINLPGAIVNNSTIVVPEYQLVQPLDQWSNMMDGIRFKFDNALPLSPSAPPFIFPSKYLLYNNDGSEFDSLEFVQWFFVKNIDVQLSYTNLASYLRRLNFDYEIEFFSEPVGDSISIGAGVMGLPFRITNLYTNKKVGLTCFDMGTNNNPSEGVENGVGDLSWTRGEEISFTNDTISIAGEQLVKYNFNLTINYRVPSGKQYNMAWLAANEYSENDTVFFGQMFWVTSGSSKNIQPSTEFIDENSDGVNDNTWRPVYPWKNGDKLIYGPAKFFENGDNWMSDMSVLGAVATVADTTLDTIKVVPNPYIVRSRFNETANSRKIRFTNLPQECRISIFTISGELVKVLDHNSQFDGNEWWDLRTANNQEVAPGLYLYHVESRNGQEKVGKFAVIR